MGREPLWRRYDRFFGADRRKDASDEIAFHVEMRVQDHMRRGMTEEAARAAVAQRMGDIAQTKKDCDQLADAHMATDQRREWFSELTQDIQYGLRILRRSPGFAVVAILTLAIGIGATTSIFSIVHRVLLAPLPYANADRIVSIYERAPKGQNDLNPVSAGNYTDWQSRAKSFAAMGAYSPPVGLTFSTDNSEPVRISAAAVTPTTFAVLGVRPIAGRLFTAEDATAGPRAMISEGFWRGRFGGDSTIVGKELRLNDVNYTVVGVLPKEIEFPAADVDAWRLIRAVDASQRRSHNYNVVARLADGASVTQAQQEMSGLATAIAAEHPEFMKDWGVNVQDYRGLLIEDAKPLLLLLICAVGVVLLTACANLASLLLARAVSREREFVLRGALGARRWRLVRQLLTESLLVAFCGGALGVGAAALSMRALIAFAPPLPFGEQTTVNWIVLAFAAGITICSTVIFGLAPALKLLRFDLQATLRAATGAAGGRRESRLRSGLLVLQVALSVMLLVGAGLFVRSFRQLQSIDVGYDPHHLAMLQLDLPSARYQGIPPQTEFYRSVLEQVRRVPSVKSVAATSLAPTRPFQTFSYTIDGHVSNTASGREDPVPFHFVLGDYFGVLNLPIKEGRAFDDRDREDAPPVAIINQSLAKMFWPNGGAVGQRIRRGSEGPWSEIVGVAADARMGQLTSLPSPLVYTPYAQRDITWQSFMNILVRTSPDIDDATLLPGLRAAVRTVDARLPVQEFTNVDNLYRGTIERRNFAMVLVTVFGGVAFLLSILGLYALVSYDVAQQRREIGVRIALGASSQTIMQSVLRRALTIVSIGLVAGLAGAAALTRLITRLLYGVSPLDSATFVATALLVVVVALIATCIPAFRAASTSPLLAIRTTS